MNVYVLIAGGEWDDRDEVVGVFSSLDKAKDASKDAGSWTDAGDYWQQLTTNRRFRSLRIESFEVDTINDDWNQEWKPLVRRATPYTDTIKLDTGEEITITINE